MKITLALGNPKDTGGPTKYAQNLAREFTARGHSVRLVSYAGWMWKLPTGARHILYALRLVPHALRSDAMLAFDTMTVGAPAALACTLMRRPLMIRIGGDFVWETYVERTGDLVKFSQFYQTRRGKWSLKEKLEVWITGLVVRGASRIVFNSNWQQAQWQPVYKFDMEKSGVLENVFPERRAGKSAANKSFVFAGRVMKLKNEPLVRRIFDRLAERYPGLELDTRALPDKEHEERVASSYAVIVASVSEMASNSIIDAVLYGKPFISTADTGLKERLDGTGLFVDTQNEVEFEHAVEQLLKPEVYLDIENKIKNFTFTRTWSDVASEALNDLEKICTS
ncbi:MAG: glucosyltransferase [Candidatus Adlerbacteria bacterium]|nr:glucosyltransferase [Candidatus Adlerbacteria bacterium]